MIIVSKLRLDVELINENNNIVSNEIMMKINETKSDTRHFSNQKINSWSEKYIIDINGRNFDMENEGHR